jgi:predicted GH43/DUF377 family glycosyl hydrolase
MHPERWLMAYTAWNGSGVPQIALATSNDGLSFDKCCTSAPVLAAGAEDSWDAGGVLSPHLCPMADSWRLYYCGLRTRNQADDLGAGIGLALGSTGVPEEFQRRTGKR